MARLIDADALERKIAEHKAQETMGFLTFERIFAYEWTKSDMYGLVKNASTIDAVPVVRCKDCMNRGNELECPMCRMVHTWNEDDGSDWYVVDNTADDGYCHCGEKMDGGAEDADGV